MSAGCRPVTPATEIVAVVTADIPPADLKGVQFIVTDPSQPSSVPLGTPGRCTCVGDGAGCLQLPLSVGLIPGSGSPSTFAVHAAGYRDALCDQPLVEQSAIVSFAARQTLELDLFLAIRCENQSCPPGTTCSELDGTCVDNHRPSLPPFGATADLGASSSPDADKVADLAPPPDLVPPPDLSPPPPSGSCTSPAIAWIGSVPNVYGFVVACESWSGTTATIQGGVITAAPASGTVGPVTPTTTLSGGAASAFHAPALGSLIDGNVLVAWQDDLGAVGASLVATNPLTPGSPFTISAAGASPAIATNYDTSNVASIGITKPAQLTYLVAFRDRNTGAVAGALLDQQAKLLYGPINLSAPGPTFRRPAVAFDGARYFVVWDDGQTIWGAHADPSVPLAPFSDATAVSATDAQPRQNPTVVCRQPSPTEATMPKNPPAGCLVGFEEGTHLELVFRAPNGKLSPGPLTQQSGARAPALTLVPMFWYEAAWQYLTGPGPQTVALAQLNVVPNPTASSQQDVVMGAHGAQVTPAAAPYLFQGPSGRAGFVAAWPERGTPTDPWALRMFTQ
jgi:hypothetical protein